MKKHAFTILLCAVLLTGLSLLLYPSFSDWWNSYRQSRALSAYAQSVAALEEKDYDRLWEQAQAYNRRLLDRSNRFLLTPQQQESYRTMLDSSGSGIMGYVRIPDISVTVPIYHGTEESVLQVAAGHLEWTSLPVGGTDTHCVISGHRGLPSARLFTDLDRLELGDRFFLNVLGRELVYQIDQICTVEPHETEELMVVPGEDLCTLVTCTPYGINSHRLLVRGSRVEAETEPQPVLLKADAVTVKPATVAAGILLPLLMVWMLSGLLPRKKPGGERNGI